MLTVRNLKSHGDIYRTTSLRYSAAQLFDLVADVERYPDFLPWVVAAKIYRRDEGRIWVTMAMGTSFLRKQFTTVAFLTGRTELKLTVKTRCSIALNNYGILRHQPEAERTSNIVWI